MATRPTPKRGPGRPWPADHVPHERVNVTLPPDAVEALDALKERWETTRSGAVKRAIEEAAARKGSRQ